MELIVVVLIGVAVYAMIVAPIKRSKHRARCPRCGTECNASPWGLLSIMRQVTNALIVVMNLLLIIANCKT